MAEHGCIHEADWRQQREEYNPLIRKTHDRICVDNGKDSIQTSLVKGDSRMAALAESQARLEEGQSAIKAHLATLASTMQHFTELQVGIGSEGLTTEGLVRMVLQKLPKGGMAASTTPWTQLAVIVVTVCVFAGYCLNKYF